MNRPETFDAINRLEQRFPVAEWSARGVRIWPLARAALSGRSFSGYVEARKHGPKPRYERGRALLEMAGTKLRSRGADLRDRSHRASTREHHDVVILGVTEAVGRVWVETGWYDRLSDPFRELLAKRGLTSLHLAPGRQFRVPRQYPCRYVQPALDLASLRTLRPPWPPGDLHLPGFDQLESTARREGLDTTDISLPLFSRQIRLLWGTAEAYEALLLRAEAKAAFVVSYGLSSMAFNLACARLGIPSIEIQHGVQGPLHWAYSRWSALPPGGYDLLPESYWVWGSEEAAVIEDWAEPAFPRHRAVPGGNLWLDSWRQGSSAAVKGADEEVRAAKERSPGDRHVLIPLHRALAGRSSLEPFVAAIAARPSWRWWIRSHPGMSSGEVTRAKRILSEVPGARVELESSELPLYAVLRHVDAVATMASSVVIEAAAMGVPSAITDADLGEQYAGEISAGWALLAGRSLAEALDTLLARTPKLPPYEKPRLAPDDALDRLLPASLGVRSRVA